MLERFFKRFRQDNGVPAKPEVSRYINIEGLESKINVPQPTAEDKRWARQLRDATTGVIGTALGSAIANNQNWRVWYLLNRPQRKSGGIIRTVKDCGFAGHAAVADGIATAAEHDNVTAAYLLLKYAEKNQAASPAGDGKTPPPVHHYTVAGLESAATRQGGDVFQLLAKTLATLIDPDMHPAPAPALIDYAEKLKKSAIHAAARGNFGHLDALVDNGLLQGPQLAEAFMKSFAFDKFYPGEKPLTAGERKNFLDWLNRRGIVDEVFADEAQAVDVRMSDARDVLQQAAAQGWKLSARDLGDDAPQGPKLQAEIALREKKGSVVYVFNESASRIHRIEGRATREIPAALVPNPALIEAAKQFLDAAQVAPPELVWKKGEPFRLRFRQPAA